MLNPTPYEAWCNAGSYPWDCENLEGVDCIRGGGVKDYIDIVKLCILGLVLFFFIAILACLGVIIYGMCEEICKEHSNNGGDEKTRFVRWTLIRQSLMYLVAYLVSYVIPIIALFDGSTVIHMLRISYHFIRVFLNVAIFTYHKVYNMKQVDDSMTNWRALYLITVKPESIMEIKLTGLSLIHAKEKADMDALPSLPSVEDGVEDASKDMHLSYARSNEEVCFMFDCTNDQNRASNNTQEEGSRFEGFEGSVFSHRSPLDFKDFDDYDDGQFDGSAFSMHDASTLKGRN